MDHHSAPVRELIASLKGDGFHFVDGETMSMLLRQRGSLDDWETFASSWDDLAVDPYLAQVGRPRRRRHAVFRADASKSIARQPHQPHFQSTDYNQLQGGFERWFEPMLPEVVDHASMQATLHVFRDVCSMLSPSITEWHFEAHQFRIEPGDGRNGEPTPEGIHRDGVDYVLAMLVDRRNLLHGTTTVHASDGRQMGECTLRAPLDAIWVDDRRVLHGVTPVVVQHAGEPAHRDVLVITGRAVQPRTSSASAPPV